MLFRKEIIFEKNQPFHVFSRAVEKRKILSNEIDCCRFIYQMYAANTGHPISNLHRRDVIKIAKAVLGGEDIPSKFVIKEHPPLVHFISFALVINHYHFVFVQNLKNGISKYMQKLNGGFAKYFNLKNDRKGVLFESRYKIVPIKTNFQSDAILRYVNIINPLDIYCPGWRTEGLKDEKEAFKFLNEYQFSSFPDLFGKRNSKILTSKLVLEKYLGREIIQSQAEFINFTKDYLQEKLSHYHSFFID